MTPIANNTRLAVWDPLVRFGHWALVIAFAVAYLSGEEEGETSELHEWAGYVVGGIVVWRIVWGLTGPRYARFSDFVTGPTQALRYLWSELTGHARRYLGHSPAGGAMVMALLLSLALTVVTGLMADQDGSKASSGQRAAIVIHAFAADERRQGGHAGQESESAIGEAHAAFANITLGLIVLHILGVALASFDPSRKSRPRHDNRRKARERKHRRRLN